MSILRNKQEFIFVNERFWNLKKHFWNDDPEFREGIFPSIHLVMNKLRYENFRFPLAFTDYYYIVVYPVMISKERGIFFYSPIVARGTFFNFNYAK